MIVDPKMIYYLLMEQALEIDANIKRCKNPTPCRQRFFFKNEMCCDGLRVEYYLSPFLWKEVFVHNNIKHYVHGSSTFKKLKEFEVSPFITRYLNGNRLIMNIYELPVLTKTIIVEDKYEYITVYGFRDHSDKLVEVVKSFKDYL